MKLLDRMAEVRGRKAQRAPAATAPVGGITVGRDPTYSAPAEYGDYLVTSNEVYSLCNFRAKKMASVPLRLYSGTRPDRVEITQGPVHDLLHHVNPFWSEARLRRMDELSMGLWGESFWAIERNRQGIPAEIWWLKASHVTPVLHESDYLSGFLYTVPGTGERIGFSTDEVVWFRYPNPNDQYAGLSPVTAARLAADTGAAMQRTNYSLFVNGLQSGAIVTPPNDDITYTAEQATQLADQLEERLQGAEKAHRWAVLRYAAQVSNPGVTPEDAQFVEGLTLTFRQVCNAYGVPSPLLNDLAEATKANLQGLQQSLWEDTLVPDLDLRAQEITEQFLPMFRRPGATVPTAVEFDTANVPALRQAQTETWDRDRGRIEVGAITINEWRKSEGLPEVEWGDTWWAPVNKAQVDADNGEVVEGGMEPASGGGGTGGGGGGQASSTNDSLARLVQQLYLGTPERAVITVNEAREMLNASGAGLEMLPNGDTFEPQTGGAADDDTDDDTEDDDGLDDAAELEEVSTE